MSGAGGAGGAGASGATLYVLTAAGQKLQAWRKGTDDEAPLLLGEVTAKATAELFAAPKRIAKARR